MSTNNPFRAAKFRFACPHCGSVSLLRNQERLSPTLNRFYIACMNEVCAHAWTALIEAQHTLSPSGTPNPSVHLPVSPAAQRRAQGLRQQQQEARTGQRSLIALDEIDGELTPCTGQPPPPRPFIADG